jgi:hypothetical protein
MKKYLIIVIGILSLFLSACSQDEIIVFEHEKEQFKTKSGLVLIEMLAPMSTSGIESFSIAGAFNEYSRDDSKWQLRVSNKSRLKWGIYIDPADFENNKTLADGFTIVSSIKGNACTLDSLVTSFKANVQTGQRFDMTVVKFEGDFQSEFPLPTVSQAVIKLSVPETTPDNADIYLYGDVNNWDGSTSLKWKATKISKTKYYLKINTEDLQNGKTLSDPFKIVILKAGRAWDFFESNTDGLSTTGLPIQIADFKMAKSFAVNVQAWKNSALLLAPNWPLPLSSRILVRLTVPDYTPLNSTIVLRGAMSGWSSADINTWKCTMVDKTHYYIQVDPTKMAGTNTLANNFKITLDIAGKSVWDHQANTDGSANDTGVYEALFNISNAQMGIAYDLTVVNWKNKALLPN